MHARDPCQESVLLAAYGWVTGLHVLCVCSPCPLENKQMSQHRFRNATAIQVLACPRLSPPQSRLIPAPPRPLYAPSRPSVLLSPPPPPNKRRSTVSPPPHLPAPSPPPPPTPPLPLPSPHSPRLSPPPHPINDKPLDSGAMHDHHYWHDRTAGRCRPTSDTLWVPSPQPVIFLLRRFHEKICIYDLPAVVEADETRMWVFATHTLYDEWHLVDKLWLFSLCLLHSKLIRTTPLLLSSQPATVLSVLRKAHATKHVT